MVRKVRNADVNMVGYQYEGTLFYTYSILEK